MLLHDSVQVVKTLLDQFIHLGQSSHGFLLVCFSARCCVGFRVYFEVGSRENGVVLSLSHIRRELLLELGLLLQNLVDIVGILIVHEDRSQVDEPLLDLIYYGSAFVVELFPVEILSEKKAQCYYGLK